MKWSLLITLLPFLVNCHLRWASITLRVADDHLTAAFAWALTMETTTSSQSLCLWQVLLTSSWLILRYCVHRKFSKNGSWIKSIELWRMTSGLQGKYIKKRSNNYLCSEDIHRYGGRCQSLFYRLNKFGKTMKTQFVSIWATFKNSLSPVKHET